MFVTHASVRVKGSEHYYDPVWCTDVDCPKHATPHMHCPFCARSEFYLDPVILRAHYRVKHVDKGIDVYGLRIVRCCDRCDFVGSIKGTKEIRGAHWHCYRCRNGFNRRDEAVKHYRTHFRSPQTTYQIQIVSDVNQAFFTKKKIIQNFTDVVSSSVSSSSNGVSGGSCSQQLVAANETVTTSTGDLQLLIVDAESVDVSCDADVTSVEMPSETDAVSSPTCWTTDSPDETLESRLADLQCQYDQLVAKNNAIVSQLQAEVAALQQQVRLQAEELAWVRSCTGSGGDAGTPSTVSELLNQLRSEHDALLQRQLDDVRNECLRVCASHAMNCIAPPVNSSQSHLVGVDDQLTTGSCVAVHDGGQTSSVSCDDNYDATANEEGVHADSLHDDITVMPHKRRHRLSTSFDLECSSADELLMKSSKLF